jgi:hypothetical protein
MVNLLTFWWGCWKAEIKIEILQTGSGRCYRQRKQKLEEDHNKNNNLFTVPYQLYVKIRIECPGSGVVSVSVCQQVKGKRSIIWFDYSPLAHPRYEKCVLGFGIYVCGDENLSCMEI